MPVALYQAVGPAGKSGSKLRRAERDLADDARASIWRRGCACFSARCAAASSAATRCSTSSARVNATLEPPKIAELIVERAATWVPAPCWAVVSSDLSGQLSVLADRGLAPEHGAGGLRDRRAG